MARLQKVLPSVTTHDAELLVETWVPGLPDVLSSQDAAERMAALGISQAAAACLKQEWDMSGAGRVSAARVRKHRAGKKR